MSSFLSRFRPQVLLVLLILTWAVSWPVIKIGVQSVPPIWFACLRYSIGLACMGALVALRRELTMPAGRDWPLIFVSGIFQMAAYAALMAAALVTLPPGRASVLAYSTPIWVVPCAIMWLGERSTATAWIGVFLGMVGIAVIASPSILTSDPTQFSAYVMLIGASMAWAITILFVRAHKFTASSFALAPWQMLIATAFLLPIALVMEGPLPEIDASGWASLAFVGPVSTAFAYWAVVEAGRYLSARTISMGLLATPGLGILISSLTLGETIDATLAAGLSLVVLGIWLAIRADRPKSARPGTGALKIPSGNRSD